MSDRSSARLTLFVILMGALLLALAGRAAQVTVLSGGELAQAASSNDKRVLITPASRGAILDWEGKPLAGTKSALQVQIDAAQLPAADAERARVLSLVGAELGLTETEIRAKLIPCGSAGSAAPPVCNEGNPAEPAVVAANLNRESVGRLTELSEQYPGVAVSSQPTRSYPRTDLSASHILGYLSRVTAEEVAAVPDANDTDLRGRSGLEEQYNADLSGRPGRREVRVDPAGRIQSQDVQVPATPGSTLITSVDAELQAAVERSLRQQIGKSKKSGGAVVLDVKTGRVLALASYPDFDPDVWTGGISERDYKKLVDRRALLNLPVQGTFPPASTFKPITVAAMERRGENLNGSYPCPASYSAAGRVFNNYNSQAFGTISLARALEVSCNTVFYRAADRLWRAGGGQRSSEIEVDPVAKAATLLGLGELTGIDLPWEAQGLIASPAAKYQLWQERKDDWCAAAEAGYPELAEKNPKKAELFAELDADNCANGAQWRQGDAINAGIGQGITAITPLQLAAAYAAIGGDGRLRTPTLGRAIRGSDGTVLPIDPSVNEKVAIRKRTREFLKSSLTAVTRSGTAAGAFAGFPLDRYPVAGKTGTAQVEGEDSTAWFASFAPAKKPRYAVVVTIAQGGGGGDAAAPVARKIYDAIYGLGQPAALPEKGPNFEIPATKPVVSK